MLVRELTTVKLGGNIIPRTTVIYKLREKTPIGICLDEDTYEDIYDDCMSHIYYADKGEESFYCIASRCKLIKEIYIRKEELKYFDIN